ncbi:hypothetical protein S40293_02559 [Stachybotrys chartarum IBT 40293]|nr:hypothetical protein S40293_02559 [Stachybotrys chartarum IBT 40293]
MALLGLSLLLASVVYVVIRPPSWLPPWLLPWKGFGGVLGNAAAQRQQPPRLPPKHGEQDQTPVKGPVEPSSDDSALTTSSESRDTMLMPPPPPPTIQTPSITEPDAASEEQTTPKATATTPSLSVPTFSLSGDPSPSNNAANKTSIMPPPPVPRAQPQTGRLPAFPAMNSIQRARGPVPNRGPPSSSSSSSSSSGLAPPPTHSSKPSKPSRKVLLSPGHSPLDWARISGPNADLRGVPPSTPFLRVPPSLLKKQNGRKGQDAWMALNGKVYNVMPYAKYHPGGVPELMRGAGRDGTKLFGEVHPWVNYETMLAACMVGILVEEPEANASEMDKMD